MQSTSIIHLETRSHLDSRDLSPRGNHSASTAPDPRSHPPAPVVHLRGRPLTAILEETTETSLQLFPKVYEAVCLDMGSRTRKRGFNQGRKEECEKYIARRHRNHHLNPSCTLYDTF
jgi:hypothetical protein